MLKQRRHAAQMVAADFLKAEAAADQAAAFSAACIATMLQQRAAANLPINTGLEALQMMTEATAELVRARAKIIEAHSQLVLVRDGIGITSFGDVQECPPMANAGEPTRESRHLKIVA